jgi:hypothetical protein
LNIYLLGPGFTFCLPVGPKVNAGGAKGVWLPGRELVRISASDDRIEGIKRLDLFVS